MKKLLIVLVSFMISLNGIAQNGIVVFQTDFGTKDGAVSAMKGVATVSYTHLTLPTNVP
jgi:hypothetical protein